jgi:hypothetical protein
MCRPKNVVYTEQCGHYMAVHYGDDAPPEACAKAVRQQPDSIGLFVWSPCATLICELEAQRAGAWGWKATVNGMTIHVSCCSSGHCDAGETTEFKKPNYKALAKAETTNKDAGSEGESLGLSTPVESLNSNSVATSDTKVDSLQGEGMAKSWKSQLFHHLR